MTVYSELPSSVVEPGTDDAVCVRCGKQAQLYVADDEWTQWFACLDCHGHVLVKLLGGQPLTW